MDRFDIPPAGTVELACRALLWLPLRKSSEALKR
jgi:hypothetical protein